MWIKFYPINSLYHLHGAQFAGMHAVSTETAHLHIYGDPASLSRATVAGDNVEGIVFTGARGLTIITMLGDGTSVHVEPGHLEHQSLLACRMLSEKVK